MNSEAVEALHTITADLKAEHERMATWLQRFDLNHVDDVMPDMLTVTRAEAERIFADRIAAHESRLKELGWARTIRVESTTNGEPK